MEWPKVFGKPENANMKRGRKIKNMEK